VGKTKKDMRGEQVGGNKERKIIKKNGENQAGLPAGKIRKTRKKKARIKRKKWGEEKIEDDTWGAGNGRKQKN